MHHSDPSLIKISDQLLMLFSFQAELAAIKEAETAEREEWERNCRQKFEASWEENEKKLAAKFESEKNEKLTTEKARIFEEMKAFKDQCKRDLEEKIW